jgi:hypothetical protein
VRIKPADSRHTLNSLNRIEHQRKKNRRFTRFWAAQGLSLAINPLLEGGFSR